MKQVICAALAAGVLSQTEGFAEAIDEYKTFRASDETLSQVSPQYEYGWNQNWLAGTTAQWGLQVSIYADLGANYHAPLYDEEPYLVQKVQGNVFVGSINRVVLVTPFVKLWLYFDVWGAKYTFFNFLTKFNTVDWSFCTMADWFLEVAMAQLYAEVQVNECFLGLISAIDSGETAVQCNWFMYRIEDPLWTYKALDFTKSGTYLPDSCDFSPLEFLTPESADEAASDEEEEETQATEEEAAEDASELEE